MTEWTGPERRKAPIEDVVKQTIHNTLQVFGFNMDNPEEIQADVKHMRRSRQICELIQNTLITTGIGIALTAVGYLMWWGLKSGIAAS